MKINHAIILAFLSMCSVLSKGQGTFSIMTYNIENAFDTIHDEGKNDYEYLIGGERNWNTYRLLKKLRSVSKVIAAANEDRPVDLIGLCEVENENVMECLTKMTPLRNMGYRYVMTSSEDARGIDVALLYSPYTFHIIEHESIYVSSDKKKTRDILHATGTIMSGDTIDAYVVHLTSKQGGIASKQLSMHAISILMGNIDSICHKRMRPNIIVMGDFNADSRSKQLDSLTKEGQLTDFTKDVSPGTYYYQGRWSCIDHILGITTCLTPALSKTIALPFMLENDNVRHTQKPYRTYLGTYYHGGVSDHLPLAVYFNLDGE